MISDFPQMMTRIRRSFPALFAWLLIADGGAAERINQEGRILGPAPVVSAPTLFNTPEADAIVSALQIMPVTNPWNEDISQRPRLANSDAMIAQIKSDLSPTRQTLRAFYEMNYVLVPDNQPRVTIPFLDYPDESDLDGGKFPNGNYPIPSDMPIESWPQGTGSLTLAQWQVDVNNNGGDRHGIIVAPGTGSFWETWQMRLTQSVWQASNGAKFDLNSNVLRPAIGLQAMPPDCRCFQQCRALTSASAAWSSTRCVWRWPRHAGNTFIRPFITLQRFRQLRRITPQWVSDCG
jgi:hypothetical protein